MYILLNVTACILRTSHSKYVVLIFQQTIEALGVAAGNVLQTPIQLAYREAFQNIVVPSFDRAMQNIFQQVNETFVKGTKESMSKQQTHFFHSVFLLLYFCGGFFTFRVPLQFYLKNIMPVQQIASNVHNICQIIYQIKSMVHEHLQIHLLLYDYLF